MHRKLAAILASDVVGYTRLMAADEVGTLRRLIELRTEVFDPLIAKFGGRIVKEMGDGLLVEFASVVDSIECGYKIQKAMADRNEDEDEDSQIQFRIGINLGDVISENDDLFGDGVNIAARIEGLSDPGDVLISESAYHQIKGKTKIRFEDQGSKSVKNVAEPIRVFRAIGIAAAATNATSSLLSRPAIAVLPFTNMSGDSEQEYFSDGLTEDIITELSYYRTFPVIARNSTFVYKGIPVDPRKVAQNLGARYVLEGSVRKAGQRVRVTAQLIDAKTGHHIWAEKHDRELTDVFELQDELTRSIAAVMEPAITQAEQTRAKAVSASNVGAWDLFLRASELMYRFTSESHAEARSLFRRALEIDPTYAQAHVGIAQTYLQGIFLKKVDDHERAVQAALEAAENAKRLDDHNSNALLSLGLGYMWSGQHDQAVAELKRASACNPSNANAYIVLGNILDVAGEPEEGISYLELGIRLNPLEPRRHFAMTWLAGAYLNARRYQEALDRLNMAMAGQSDYPLTHLFKAICHFYLGDKSSALQSLQECEAVEDGFAAEFVRWRAYKNDADNEHMIQPLLELGLKV